MNSSNAPPKQEVMRWNPQSLSDYMRRLNLTGCDKVVMKGSITGAQFMQMSPCDLQVFPSLYISLITKIQRELNKEEQKQPFSTKLKAHKHPKSAQDYHLWDSDSEFDNESDNEYESPDQGEVENGYICPVESQTALGNDKRCEGPSAYAKPPRRLRDAKIQDFHSREKPVPAERLSKPPIPPHPSSMNHTHQRPLQISVSQPNPHVDRSKKPGQPRPSQRELSRSRVSAVKPPLPDPFTSRSQPRIPKPRDNRASKLIPPPVPTEPAMVNMSIPEQGMDPSWYGGNINRHQAEFALREVNKDGAFVVRDSTKGIAEHPYTLMLLKQGKIFNIKIRNQGNSYSLGNGINNTKGVFDADLCCTASLGPCHLFVCCCAIEFPWGEGADYPSHTHTAAAH